MYSRKPQQYRRLAATYRKSAETQPVGTRERSLAHAVRLDTLAQEVEEMGIQTLKVELAQLPSKHKLLVFAVRLGIEIEDVVIAWDREDLRDEILRQLVTSRPASNVS